MLVLAAVAGVTIARRWPGRPTVWLCRALAAAIFAAWAGEYVADVVTGIWTLQYDLPLQLTDTISVVATLALWTRRRTLVELTFMWALSASLQATLTPDLAWTFPSVFYFTFFIYHEGAIVGGLVLVFGLGLYPRHSAWWRTFAATLVVAAGAGIADLLVRGADYMFLAAKPPYASLLNALGPWPWYLPALAAVSVLMLLVVQGVAGLIERRDRRARGGDQRNPSWRGYLRA